MDARLFLETIRRVVPLFVRVVPEFNKLMSFPLIGPLMWPSACTIWL